MSAFECFPLLCLELLHVYVCAVCFVCDVLYQMQEQLEANREQCHGLESQLQKKEAALLAAQSKVELLTSDLQNKVGEQSHDCHVIMH